MAILNLTPYPATPEQVAAGVVDPDAESQETIRTLCTFDFPPTLTELRTRAETLAQYAATVAAGCRSAMIGGAPFFMAPLEAALRRHGIRPLYACSRFEIVETPQEDGTLISGAVFRHVGFVGVEEAERSLGDQREHTMTSYERALAADAEARRVAYAFAAGLECYGLARLVTYRNHITGQRVAIVRPDGHVTECWSGIDGPTEDGGYRLLTCAGERQS